MKSKVLKSILVLCLLVVGIGNAWGDQTLIGDFYYNLSGTASTGYKASLAPVPNKGKYELSEVRVLETVKEIQSVTNWVAQTHTVNAIANDAFENSDALKIIYTGKNVTSIGQYAFRGCSNLETVIFENNSISTFEKYTFNGCSSLKEITFPYSVASVGDEVFGGCTSLKDIYIYRLTPPTLGTNSLGSLDKNTTVHVPYGAKANYEAIEGWNNLTIVEVKYENQIYYKTNGISSGLNVNLVNEVTIDGLLGTLEVELKNEPKVNDRYPEYGIMTFSSPISSIPNEAFKKNHDLLEITIPGNVQTIGSSAFANCSGLNSVTLEEGVTTIEASAFSGCTYMKSITVPSTLESIGKDAFYGTALTSISLSSIPTGLENLPTGCSASIALTDESNVSIGAAVNNLTTLTYSRTINSASIWGTLMLPFEISTNDNVQLYQLKKADFENGILSFEQKSTIEANTPCVFKKKTENATSLTIDGGASVTVDNSQNVDLEQGESKWTLKGTYESITLRVDANGDPDETAADVYFIASNKFNKATQSATVTMNPYRAWFECSGNSNASDIRSFRIEIENSETGVKTILGEEESAAIMYDLMGRQQTSTQSGKINIINGKKSIVK